MQHLFVVLQCSFVTNLKHKFITIEKYRNILLCTVRVVHKAHYFFLMGLQGHPSPKHSFEVYLLWESKHVFVTTGHFFHCSCCHLSGSSKHFNTNDSTFFFKNTFKPSSIPLHTCRIIFRGTYKKLNLQIDIDSVCSKASLVFKRMVYKCS